MQMRKIRSNGRPLIMGANQVNVVNTAHAATMVRKSSIFLIGKKNADAVARNVEPVSATRKIITAFS
jgi:hypothetical protein